MEIKDRIATVMHVNKLTASAFAEALDVQRSNISHILNGRNKPSLDFIEKMLYRFPRVDAKWLITGEAPKNETAAKEPGIKGPALVEPEIKDAASSKKGAGNSGGTRKSVEKVVVFYADRTFDIYFPNI